MATKVQVGPGPEERFIDQESDVSISAAGLVDIPGLAFDMQEGVTYEFEFYVRYVADGTTDVLDLSVSGPAALTGIITFEHMTALGSHMQGEVLAAGAVTRTATGSAITTTPLYVPVKGKVSNAVNATFQLQAGGGATDTITISNSSGRARISPTPAV